MLMYKGMPKKWSGVYAMSMERNNSLRGFSIFHAQASEKEVIRIPEWLYRG